VQFLRVSSLILAPLILTGCSHASNEISEIEKRNRFDACVLDFMADEENNKVSEWKFNLVKFRHAAEISCREILK
jgi:hypothetical protein